jgi:hypothetical protein
MPTKNERVEENWAEVVALMMERIAITLETFATFATLRDRIPSDPERYEPECAKFENDSRSLVESLDTIGELGPFPASDELRVFLAKLRRCLNGLHADMQLQLGHVPDEFADCPPATCHWFANLVPAVPFQIKWQQMMERRVALHDQLHDDLLDWADRLMAFGASEGKPPEPEKKHSADFTCVNWYGTEYTFALGVQASAVEALWHEWEMSGLGVHQSTIGLAMDAEHDNFRLDKTFRNHPAFGTMIQSIGDGKYKLNPPATAKATPVLVGKESAKSAGIPSKARRKPR